MGRRGPPVYEEKAAQQAASEVLASVGATLLHARASGVSVPVMRLKLQQVRTGKPHEGGRW